MKSLIRLIGAVSVLLSGCNLNPDALLGNQPSGGHEVVVNTYEACREKNVEMASKNFGRCTPPDQLADFVHSVGEVYGKERLRITLMELPHSRQFPAINSVTYRTYGYGSTDVRVLKCEQVNDPNNIPDRYKVVECWVEAKENESQYTDFYFESMEVGNAGEGCDPKKTRTTYHANFLLPQCTVPSNSYSGSVEDIYLNRERLPRLRPVKKATDPEPKP